MKRSLKKTTKYIGWGEKKHQKVYATKSGAQRDKKFKEKPCAKWDKGSGDLKARPHTAKLPAYEKEWKENLRHEGNYPKQKAGEDLEG